MTCCSSCHVLITAPSATHDWGMLGACCTMHHVAPPCWKNPLIFAYKNPTIKVGPTTVGPFLPRVGFCQICQVSSHRTNAVPDRPCPPVPTWHVRSFVHLSEMQHGETSWNCFAKPEWSLQQSGDKIYPWKILKAYILKQQLMPIVWDKFGYRNHASRPNDEEGL